MQWVAGRNYLQKTDATITYLFDWTDWLEGATIASFTVTGTGLTVTSSAYGATGVAVSVSGADLATRLTLTCSVTTSANPYAQTDSRSVTIEGTAP